MASSEVQICNLALARLGAKSITALTDDNKNARECNRVYEHARDSELRAHKWGFARERVELAALSTDPAFGYAKQYQMPADCLFIIPSNGRRGETPQTDFLVEGRKILTDNTSPVRLVYIRKVTDVTQFDALFTELLISRIAYDTCETITQSSKKKEDAAARYKVVKHEARRVNSFENPPEEAPEDGWIDARR